MHDVHDMDERHRTRYRISGDEALLAAEAHALGSDYRGNGYTTLTQARALGEVLGLGRGHLLIDVGGGCGWPGVYLAARHHCRVVTLEPVGEGLVAARRRSEVDGLADRSWQTRARAEALPLRSECADAVVHTDVMC